MAYVVQVQVTYAWVPDGAGGAAVVGGAQANVAGYGAAGGPGSIGNAQKMEIWDMEPVPGGDSPTQANFNTAVVNAAAAINTKMGTAGSTGFSTGTPLVVAQGWSTGLP